MRYNNYHKHTHYSNLRTLDVIVKPMDYINRARELGHTTYFTTEHGWGGNVWEAYTLCQETDMQRLERIELKFEKLKQKLNYKTKVWLNFKDNNKIPINKKIQTYEKYINKFKFIKQYNLKCIFGVEAYYVDDRFKKDNGNYHVILVAKNNKGFKDINRIISEANKTGFYYKPRIDKELILSLNPENVYITTACIASRLFKTENYEEEFLIPIHDHFKNHLFLEVQAHNENAQIEHNKKILELQKKHNIEIIHANDSHYIKSEDRIYRDMFLNAKGMNYGTEDSFLLDYPSYDEILHRYKIQGVLSENQVKKAINNTLIFDKCEDLGFTKEFKIPKVIEGDSNKEYKKIIVKEWNAKKENKDKSRRREYINEIKNEVKTVIDCGMSDYFILDYLIIKRAIEKYDAIITRSGRGSAVSFITNNILGLTEVDRLKAPIKLYPSRFMTAERILKSKSLPDIDLNFADVEPVIKASKDILGEDGIYYMIAFKPLQESSAFRLWCKAKGMNINDYNEIAKNLEDYIDDEKWGKAIEESKIFIGVIESVAPSPCSFLLYDKPISEEVGLIKVGDEICCCIDGYQCDQWKFLKNDYLTVSVYKLISETYKSIGKPIDTIEQLLKKVDDKVWKLYEDGITATLNQADSDFARNLVMQYTPKSLGELSAWVAAIRPGFASLLNNFIQRKSYSTGVKELDELLKDSYHYMLYQESIMKFLTWLDIPEKDTYDIIKKIAKKKFKENELIYLKKKLHRNWYDKVGKEEGFKEAWQVINDAVSYSFNASHAISVAIDSLYGAYLKANYPLEYMTVALNEYLDDIDKTTKITNELSYFNIKLSPPKFRYSRANYMFDKENNTIYKGISSIKYLNRQVAEELYELRDKQYPNFARLLHDIKTNTSIDFRQLKILATLNYFSEFGKNKKLLDLVELYEKRLKNKNLKEKTKQKRLLEIIEKEKGLKDDGIGIKKQIEEEKEYYGYEVTTFEKAPKNFYIITEIDTKYAPRLRAYCIKTGNIETWKCHRKDMKKNPFGEFNVLRVKSLTEKFKRKKIDGKWVQTDEKEMCLTDWEIVM